MKRLFALDMITRAVSSCSLFQQKRALTAYRQCRYQFGIRMTSTLPHSLIFEAIKGHNPHKKAIVHSLSDRSFTYGGLLHDVAATRDHIANGARSMPLHGQRIAFLAESGYDYVGAPPIACFSRSNH